jgi:hypothetical protein
VIEALTRRFPNIRLPRKDDICYATQNRQNAVKKLIERAQLVLVVGSPASSNANRLVELTRKAADRGLHGPERRRSRSRLARRTSTASASPRARRHPSCSSKTWSTACAPARRRLRAGLAARVDEGVVFQIPPELR